MIQVATSGQVASSHVHLLVFLFVGLSVPNDGRMGTEGEDQANCVRKEEQDCREPGVRPDSFEVEAIVDGRSLRKVTTATVPIAVIEAILGAAVAVEFMLFGVSIIPSCREELNLRFRRFDKTGWVQRSQLLQRVAWSM